MKTNSRRGFSQGEMIIAVSLMSLLIATLIPCLILYSKIYTSITATSDFNRQMRVCKDVFSMDALVAEKFTLSDNILVIRRKDKATVTYALEGRNTLTRTVGDEKMTLLKNVSNLAFTNPAGNANVVQLEATVKKESIQGHETLTTMAATLVKRN